MKDTNPKDAIANGKVPLSLCSPVAMARWAEAMVAGREKYGSFNYRVCGASATVYAEGAMRHLQRYLAGEDLDPDDLVTNLGAAMANISIILDAQAAGTLNDDRPPPIPLQHIYLDVERSVKRLHEKYADRMPKHYTIATNPDFKDEPSTAPPPKLQIGCRVRVLGPPDVAGQTGVCVSIEEGGPWPVEVTLDDCRNRAFYPDELEVLTEPAPVPEPGEIVVGTRVRAKRDFYDIEAGEEGKVLDVYGWDTCPFLVQFASGQRWLSYDDVEVVG